MQIWSSDQASPTTRAGLLIGFGALMAAASIAMLLLAITQQHIALWIVAPLVGVIAAVMLASGITMLRNAKRAEAAGRLLPVRPQPAIGAPQPWTWQQLAGDLAARFEGGPYAVTASDRRIRVTADLAHAAFLTPAALRNVRDAYTTDIEPAGEGRVRLTDTSQQVETKVGADGTPRLFATGGVRSSSGRVIRRTRRIEFGADAQGVGRKVDIDFSSADVREPIEAALADGGLRKAMSAEAKGAIVVGCIALLAVPLVPLMLWLQSIGVIPE